MAEQISGHLLTSSVQGHLDLVRLRPGMYGLDGTYHNLVTYLYGYDAGTGYTAFAGFAEWLQGKLGRHRSLTWAALAIEVALPDLGTTGDYHAFGPAENDTAIAALFHLLADFLADRAAASA
jgi:hypothetical protein